MRLVFCIFCISYTIIFVHLSVEIVQKCVYNEFVALKQQNVKKIIKGDFLWQKKPRKKKEKSVSCNPSE